VVDSGIARAAARRNDEGLHAEGHRDDVCGRATAVKLAAKKVEGVKDATASYEKGTAEIAYDSAKTSPDAIAKVVTEQSGFKAEVQKKQKS